ncbi:MAG: type II toxin-antitoxin system RelE/ParE family toxin [Opitutaceae bacterium]|nr:type II toxin-antitoxin system RelE/ParE family toxin [Opitutaceae bacterium]
MSFKHPIRVIFYRTEAGGEPVREWLKSLPKDERTLIGEDIKTIQYRWPLGMPLVRHMGDKVFEVRTHLPNRIARTLFFVDGDQIILLHGFVKKTQKTPAEDLTAASKRKRNYLNSHD